MAFRSNTVDPEKAKKRKEMALIPTSKMATRIRVAFHEWLTMPPGTSFMALAQHLNQLYPDQFEPPSRKTASQLAKWHRDYEWDKAVLNTSLAAKTERLRMLVQIGEAFCSHIQKEIKDKKELPSDKTIASLRGIFSDIENLTGSVKPDEADMRLMGKITIETMIGAIESHTKQQIIALPPSEYGDALGA